MTDYHHVPVLLGEVISHLGPCTGESFVDATLGGAGYSKAILEKVGSTGSVLSIDADLDAVKNAEKQKQDLEIKNWTIAHGNFREIDALTTRHGFNIVNGIVADLGFSSYQLDQAERGISFQKKELLDMRFDQRQKDDARFYLNGGWTEQEMAAIFWEYGEEKFSRQIARKISEARKGDSPGDGSEIKYTTDLYRIIEAALPKPVRHKAGDSARRVFQAVRIAVNGELDSLQDFLPKAFDILAPGGRLAVVSFHSLEDRIVKQFFQRLAKGCVCPPEFPQCICGKNPKARLLDKKPVTASPDELATNPRSKPAKLRAIIKL